VKSLTRPWGSARLGATGASGHKLGLSLLAFSVSPWSKWLMAIKGRRPTPTPVAAVLGIENNKGQLVARRDTGEPVPRETGNFVGYELKNTPSFSLQEAAMDYFRLYTSAQPKGYFSDADVPLLEKLCVLNVLYDRAMNEYLERALMKIDEVLGGEQIDPHFAMMTKLTDAIARLTKLLGIGPLDRGRPVVDKFGKPVVYGNATEVKEESEHERIQGKYWGEKAGRNRGLN